MEFKKLFTGKKGIIFGVANEKSIAWTIAKRLHEEGAYTVISYQNEYFKKKMQGEIEKKRERVGEVICDFSDESQIERLRGEVLKYIENIDFLVHSLAFAPRQEFQNRFLDTTLEGYLLSQKISVYSLLTLVQKLEQDLNNGCSILTLTFLGSEKVVPGYKIMGPVKASLESCLRYLAYDLGERGIRINAISAGPILTSAAKWIPDFQKMLEHHQKTSPLKRNITLEEVANTALFLLSDLASGITGEIIHVDCGYHILSP
ncbi:MAG: enoyl-ACP reductase [Candidatus Omnitrophica bacterium]|nr:enoyl-ACP reductase [Candidatus Omnitrophota bacterium]